MALSVSTKTAQIVKGKLIEEVTMEIGTDERVDAVPARVTELRVEIEKIMTAHPEWEAVEVAKYLEQALIFGPIDYNRHFHFEDLLSHVMEAWGKVEPKIIEPKVIEP